MVVEGIYFGETLEATMTQMYMPSRVHAELTLRSIVVAPVILLVATQVAAVLPALRVRRILPALALRHLA
jgi:hypothetical protein